MLRPLAPTLALATALASGCATAGGDLRHAAPGPGPGGGAAASLRGEAPGASRWHQLSTGHVDLWTDADLEPARRLAARLERLHLTLATALTGRSAPPPGRVRVVLLSDRAHLADLAGPRVAGFFTALTEEPTAVAAADLALVDPSVLAHELSHHLVARLLVRPPPWLDEGLAEALETAGDPEVTPGTVGTAPRWLRPGWRPGPGFVRRLFDWDGLPDPREPRREASAAWLLVHFLQNEEPARLAAWLGRLEAGHPAEPAWGAVFPEWSRAQPLGPDLLEARVLDFLEAGRRVTRAWEVPDRVAVTVRPASAAEARMVRLELPRRERRAPEALRAEVTEALRLDPAHPAALRWLAQLDGLPALPLARRAVEAHPDDWRAWSFLAAALRSAGAPGQDRVTALEQAAALAPGRASPLRALALHLAEAGRVAEAAPLAWVALELRPWDPAVLDAYAEVALGVSSCPVAPDAARRLGAVLAAPPADAERLGRARRLDRLERRCDLAGFAESAFAPVQAMAGRGDAAGADGPAGR